ncbi:MAG: DNA-3-methyladenine glycosylase 2 family protein [Candidatus Woesebacteria bacterium]|nr:DNA-3-methyladenine glycosylase 2 family protein [Candidatus Woesebacteria bacterium]
MKKDDLRILNYFKKVDKKIHKVMKSMDFEKWKKVIREEEDYFINLTRSIIGQQLSGKAAATIIGRFEDLFPKKKIDAILLLKFSDETLRGVGMSYSKASFIKDLAKKTLNGEVSFKNIKKLSDEEIINHLTKVKGIGPWTAEMFLMFSLARPNIFSHKDLGLNRAIQKLYGFKNPPTVKQVEKIISNWEPFKSYASFALWESLDNR